MLLKPTPKPDPYSHKNPPRIHLITLLKKFKTNPKHGPLTAYSLPHWYLPYIPYLMSLSVSAPSVGRNMLFLFLLTWGISSSEMSVSKRHLLIRCNSFLTIALVQKLSHPSVQPRAWMILLSLMHTGSSHQLFTRLVLTTIYTPIYLPGRTHRRTRPSVSHMWEYIITLYPLGLTIRPWAWEFHRPFP